MSKVYVVIGAGFRGFCDALALLSVPGARIYIVDREPYFGGISYSGRFAGFSVDKGVHMFDSIPSALADNVREIMDGQVREVEFVSVSAFNGITTDGYSLPDLSSLPASTREQITLELRELANVHDQAAPARSLLELFHQRYGRTAGDIFAGIFQHVYNIDAAQAQPDAIARTSLGRLKYQDDPEMIALKGSHPFLDNVLAARRKALGKIDDLESLYPATGDAMRGWCDRAQRWLEARGVTMCLGHQITALEVRGAGVTVVTDKARIEADKIIWTNDNTQALASLLGFDFDTRSYVSGTPMLFATLVTRAEDIKNFTYLQNFDREGVTYRTASAGIYSGQVDAQGNSFVTCECPAPMGSSLWNEHELAHERIWQECKDLGIVASDAKLVAHQVMRVPVTFKVSKLGYDEQIAQFQTEVARRAPSVIFRDVKPFFRRDIYLDSLKIADLVQA